MLPLGGMLTVVVVATVFGAGILFLVSLVGPKPKVSKVKQMPYECGVVGTEQASTKISIKYYLTAILFILFDIEIVFIYPWALIYAEELKTNPFIIFVEMMVFVIILFFGLFYVWRSKALEWE